MLSNYYVDQVVIIFNKQSSNQDDACFYLSLSTMEPDLIAQCCP